MSDIAELRERAKALGYKTIQKRGRWFEFIDPDGERVDSCDGYAALSECIEDIEKDNARLAAEAPTGLPDFDAMSDDELARWFNHEGSFDMTSAQRCRARVSLRSLRKRAVGFEIQAISAKGSKLSTQEIQDIQIPHGRRDLNEATVADLMKSIERIGLQSPPIIRWVRDVVIDGEEWGSAPYLVAGLHRLEAMRRLGHLTITCLTLDLNDVDAELTEISENLHRAELTALQRDEQIARWIELTTVKDELPDLESKPVQPAQVSGGRGNKGGLSDAARELGVERTDAYRAIKVASLSPDAKAIAVETGLADNRSALLAAAKQRDPEKQVASLHQWRQRKHAEVMAAASTLPAIAYARAGDAKLDKRLASMKVKVEEKEAQRQAQEHRANIAVRQVDSATNRAMYAEAEVERLRAEMERLTEENALLRSENARLADWNALPDESQYKLLMAFIGDDVRSAFLARVNSGTTAA